MSRETETEPGGKLYEATLQRGAAVVRKVNEADGPLHLDADEAATLKAILLGFQKQTQIDAAREQDACRGVDDRGGSDGGGSDHDSPPKSDSDALLRFWEKARADYNREHHMGGTNDGRPSDTRRTKYEHQAPEHHEGRR